MNLSFYIVFFALISLLVFFAYITNNVKLEEKYVQVELSVDDTIWKLAEEYADKHTLTNTQFISWVEQHNHVNANHVRAGLSIFIPIKKTEVESSLMAVADNRSY